MLYPSSVRPYVRPSDTFKQQLLKKHVSSLQFNPYVEDILAS